MTYRRNVDRSQAGTRDLFLVHNVQAGSGAHLQCLLGFLRAGKAPGRKRNHLTPTNAEVKKAWSPTPIPPHAFVMLTGTMTQGKTAFRGISCFLVTF
jgi:hypothetical protein